MLARARLVAAGLLLVVGASACGGGASAAPDPCDGRQIRLPSVLGGLSVKANKGAAAKILKEAGTNTYARQASVFVLREGSELRGIFEIVRLAPDARTDDPEFRRKIVAGVGGGNRRPENINGVLVYKAKQNSQLFFIWFQECFLEVLIVREDSTVQGAAVGVNVSRLLTETLALRPSAA